MGRTGAQDRGIRREHQTIAWLRERDWFAMRAPGSLGSVDVVALKDGERARLIEVKSTAAGPYAGFLPAHREGLSFMAKLAGADAYLVWWPSRGEMQWIPEKAWPAAGEMAA